MTNKDIDFSRRVQRDLRLLAKRCKMYDSESKHLNSISYSILELVQSIDINIFYSDGRSLD